MSWNPLIVIIGAGAGGICAAVQLKLQLGCTNVIIYEKDDDIGGTWWANRYPGCACDVASHLYSFSFAPNPNWTRRYAGSDEIRSYLHSVVDQYDIRHYIQLKTEVKRAEWNEGKQEWELTIQHKHHQGEAYQVTANILVNASGILRVPHIPQDIISQFDGEWTHSASWKADIPLENKTVAVIGNGASGVQVIPSIAPKVKQLYVFQRTPTWVRAKGDYSYLPSWKFMLKWLPGLGTLYRWYLFWELEFMHEAFRRNSIVSSIVGYVSKRHFEGHLQSQLPSPQLQKILKPSYEIGCKRIGVSDDYYPTFMRPNVTVITEPITSVKGRTIYSGDGNKTTVDTIILATGFRPDMYVAPMTLIGRHGQEISEYWKTRPIAYYGFCCHHFPNTFFLLGPNSILGHNSVLFIIECQVNAIIQIIKTMIANNYRSAEVKLSAQNALNEEINNDMKNTVWLTGCNSWYQNEGREVYTIWPKSCVAYWRSTRKVIVDDFQFKH